MRAKAGIFILIILMLLVGLAEAADDSNISITKDWPIANGIDQSTVTVLVQNTSGHSISGAKVDFTVNNSVYGTLNPATFITGSSGLATSTFKVNTKSGTANLTAKISYNDGMDIYVEKSVLLNIDHDSPYVITFNHPLSGNVTEEVPFNISVTDRHGNPIDNRTGNHTINLHVHGPAPDNCSFVDYGSGFIHDISPAFDSNGNLSVKIKLTSKIGNNYISMDSFGSISDKIESILAVANGVPYSLEGTISNGGILPVSNEIPANGLDKFTINYFLYDFYKNPLQNRSVLISTNLTDELTPQSYRTNSLGQIQITYGPKVSVITANITAVADGYPSVTNSSYAKFVGSDIAANLYLVVTPQTMASRDCASNTTRQATVVAILSDSVGIPVTTGEDVTFTISGISTAPNNAQPGPSFDSGTEILTKTVTTDNNGIAQVTFYPGSFITNSDSTTGYCTITATTSTYTSNPVTVEWKNFAYLSVTINATPRTVLVNDIIDITIQITGDGYKMVSNPITVILDIDASDSMNGQAAAETNGLDRFDNAKIAAKEFVASMNNGDMVGVVSHGNISNEVYWTDVANLSFNPIALNNSISSMVKHGGTVGPNAISMNQSVYAAADKILGNPFYHAGEIDAIITLSDSPIRDNEVAPLVQKTWGNNIRVYSILYVSTSNECDSQIPARNIKLLDNQTQGKFFCAQSIGDVIQNLTEIKDILSDIAGVNTSMNLDFEHPSVNNETTFWSGSDVFDYVPIGPFVNHTKGNIDPLGRTSIIWTDGNQSVVNQSDSWTAANNYQLKFDIGTIRIKETWEATFRLRVLKEGVIDLFGPGSSISYNDFPGNLHLPTTLITSVNKTPPGFHGGNLDVSNLIVTKSGNFTDYVPLEWSLKYEGFNTATETLCYCVGDSCPDIGGCPNGPWVLFETRPDIEPGMYTLRNTQLDVKNLPMEQYWVRVHAFAPPAPDDEETYGPINVGYAGVFIKLS
jgi:hypothetical protein